jgi:hypothetical protein
MPQLQVLQPCDARAVEVAELADAIGVEIVRKLAHGEGAGAYEVRVGDGMPAVLKVDAHDGLDTAVWWSTGMGEALLDVLDA